ncbi:unnamed protein product [Phytophthora fragariaefolia]|uniref:Unnamed protein product n=1 Tax=Phytophthora fragariaefolia TaxID=1490495 RepID=A0A9W6Y391_9STRA|nr:unnamed protein product [Phytophthora fragariaefolia]
MSESDRQVVRGRVPRGCREEVAYRTRWRRADRFIPPHVCHDQSGIRWGEDDLDHVKWIRDDHDTNSKDDHNEDPDCDHNTDPSSDRDADPKDDRDIDPGSNDDADLKNSYDHDLGKDHDRDPNIGHMVPPKWYTGINGGWEPVRDIHGNARNAWFIDHVGHRLG